MSAVSYRQRGSGAGPASKRRRPPESLVGGTPLDQLWLWKCFNYTSEIASSGLTIVGPQEAGKWSLWALTVSNNDGLRFSSPVSVQVFRPLQAEFHLPSSLRVRETLEVDIKIENNINSCMDITALLALSEGAQFLSNGLLYVTERLRLGPHGATSLVVRLLVTTPGLKNMTVEVNGYTSPSCEGSEDVSNTSLAGAVVRSATVNVHPEGIVKSDTESAYFCANENMVISTADTYKYEWIGAPRNKDGIIMELKAGSLKRLGLVHIALANNHFPSDKMYRITIGDADNTISWIGRGKHEYGVQLARVETPGILSQDEWTTFWVSWEKNVISFGRGSVLYNNTLLKLKMDKKFKIQQIGFASSWGSFAKFRIWNFNDESGFSQVLHLDTPRSVVPGSESGELLISGGLALPSLSKYRATGGLSNTLSSLTNLLVINHLGNETNETLKQYVLDNLPGQVQTILSFRKVDNSFSEHQMVDSHIATVLILEALSKIQKYFSIDPDLIQSVKKWVQLRQEDDGSFLPLHADIKYPSEINYTLFKNVSDDYEELDHISEITADTIISLYEIGVENDVDAETLQKAKVFLENVLPKIKSSEALAAVTLALVLARSATATYAVEKLHNVSTTDDGDFGWPHLLPKRDAADWLYESEAGRTLKEPIIATVEDYKASLYALTTFCLIGDLKSAESVTKYLFYRSHMLDKHRELLYPAVKAFTRYDFISRDKHRSLTVSLATSGMELTDTLEIKPNQAPTILHLPSIPTKVFVYATGAGCATVQGKTSYSSYSVKNKTPLLELWSGVIQEILPDRSSVEEIEGKSPMLKIKTCFRWKDEKPSGVLRMDVILFSGFELTSAPPTVLDPKDMADMQYGYNGNNLWFIFANVNTTCPVCIQYLTRSTYVISSLRPAFVKIYPANREDLAAQTFFHTKSGSTLLKGIAEDDIITWFGKNYTYNTFNFNECMKNLTTEQVTVTSTTQETTTPLEDEKLGVSTYTINVDKERQKEVLIEPTAIIANESEELNSTDNDPLLLVNITDEIILQDKISTVSPLDVKENLVDENDIKIEKKLMSVTEKVETISTDTTALEDVNKINETQLEKSISTTIISPINTDILPKIDQLMVDMNVSPPKHVNTVKQEVPLKLYETPKTTEEPKPTFAPEIKNDKYVLLDKEQLWGLLKEVVDGELKKNSKPNINNKEELSLQDVST